ncbi:hypothetical protein FGO68_gene4613 [Halteria grandinella]|uniref:Uncharacterized protein n=1 Tax=Halteria grandinella TaxID=5974 RepID=A0A8J8T1M8_HALGN|nr:hypothetical protein FGO68_gene4613 [Halteria grandinella]
MGRDLIPLSWEASQPFLLPQSSSLTQSPCLYLSSSALGASECRPPLMTQSFQRPRTTQHFKTLMEISWNPSQFTWMLLSTKVALKQSFSSGYCIKQRSLKALSKRQIGVRVQYSGFLIEI